MAHVRSHGHGELEHNGPAFAVAGIVCVGVVLSYVPQALRIYMARSSVGLSPWFLFLGATSSASAMFNVLLLQWPIVRHCGKDGALSCVEHSMGIMQVGLQWFMFTFMYVLALTQLLPVFEVLCGGRVPAAECAQEAPPTQAQSCGRRFVGVRQ